MTDHDDLEALRDHGEQVFDGFVVVGVPVTEGRDNNAPVCTIRHGIDAARAERLIWHLRHQAAMLESVLLTGNQPPPPQLPGDEWKTAPQ